MADLTKRIIFIVLYWLSDVTMISSSTYCEGGVCNLDEYCCGTNKCCPNEDSSRFYTFGWVMAGLLIAALICGGLFKYKNRLLKMFMRSSDREPFAA